MVDVAASDCTPPPSRGEGGSQGAPLAWRISPRPSSTLPSPSSKRLLRPAGAAVPWTPLPAPAACTPKPVFAVAPVPVAAAAAAAAVIVFQVWTPLPPG